MAADDKLILLGVIGAAHGIKGEVRIKAFTGDPLAIADYGPLTDEKGRRFEIAEIRPAKEVVVARLKGITSREAAESLNGVNLFVSRDKIPAPEDEDEFLQADLIGCAVVGPDGVVLGTVTTVANYGAGDLLDILLPDGRSVLMPFTKAFAPRIDIAARRIEAVPPEGLFEADDDD
ncbi:ribosome maturation factor RimM [Bosea sp. RAC05]|jgi:16S rRNA processing protein RimM|uniref:ribosome maturation factor RimM n=1 Tax=unclassified Bosea (in: a-proteobacteria) TaxID=2653178 RepID=UPI00085643A9|nr:ribosome maturation factor RimM [Bosea sp. RAC05]AOG07744.1 16S rRNA processing protein RimM [Bosea sp. RAC05]MBA4270874.1 ribosome maturation factor RimM [Methylobacterium sp.]